MIISLYELINGFKELNYNMKLNIYYTNLENLRLEEMMQKYHVSKSTIFDKVVFYFTKYLLAEHKEYIVNDLQAKYVYKDNANAKSCIKIKEKNVMNGLYEKNKSRAYTNIIKIYLKKHINMFINEEHTKMFHQELNTCLQKTIEPNYDYNRIIRTYARWEHGKKH